MKHFLIVVDMQKDFVDGALGTKEAVAMVPDAVKEIESFDGEIIATFDTHSDNYLATAEGRKLPVPHCIRGTDGWELDADVKAALDGKDYLRLEKPSFGSMALPAAIERMSDGEDFDVEMIGLCTDICVVTNALILKAAFPEASLSVKASCCAGVTPEAHDAALATMKSCQIDVI